MADLSSVGQSAASTQSTLYSQPRPDSTELSYLFENAKFDICRNLNDSASLSLDLKRIQCINNNNGKLETPDFQYDCSLESFSSSLTNSHKSANSTQPASLTFDMGDSYPLCSTPHGTQIPGAIPAFFDVTREDKNPKKLDFDDSFSFVVNESFLRHLDVVEEKESPGESGETLNSLSLSSSEPDLRDKNRELVERNFDGSSFGESFWITAGQAAEID